MQCRKHRNKKIHNTEYQKERINQWYIALRNEALQSNNSYIKRCATTREINIKTVSINSIKNWIRVLKEIKKKELELLQDDIRLFFAN